jgi:hypothetical protein
LQTVCSQPHGGLGDGEPGVPERIP